MNFDPHNPFIDAASRLHSSLSFVALAASDEAHPQQVTRLTPAACGWVIAQLAAMRERPMMLVMPHESEALVAIEGARLGIQVGTIAETHPELIHFAAPALTPYQETDPALRVLAGHARALAAIADQRSALIVVDSPALLRPLSTPEHWRSRCQEICPGSEIERGQLLDLLMGGGYERIESVAQVGEFSVRGALVDIYSPAAALPVRVEFWGDEVVGLREFDPRDQRTRSTVSKLVVLPMLPFAAGKEAMRQLTQLLSQRKSPLGEEEADRRLRTLAGGGLPSGWTEWLAMASGHRSTLLEWIDPQDTILWDPSTIEQVLASEWQAIETDASTRNHKIGFNLPAHEVAVDPDHLGPNLARAAVKISVWLEDEIASGKIDFGAIETELLQHTPDRLSSVLDQAERNHLSVYLLHADEGKTARRFLDERGFSNRVVPVRSQLENGFVLPDAGIVAFAERQLYPPVRAGSGRSGASQTRSLRSQRATFLGGLKDLKVGDFVVHDEHGIGRYAGLRDLSGESGQNPGLPAWAKEASDAGRAESMEVLEISYRDGRTLLLPLDRAGSLTRFTGVEGMEPRLDKLGGSSWQLRRDRVRSGVKKLAIDLLDLYAQRSAAQATAMPGDGPLLRQFEESFPYDETPDQLRAINEIRADLERNVPMDRLLCGDVGFGKTEVAMRAAAQAVEAGRQVAILAPTTILADQHLTSFRRRFRGLPVRIEMVSRFRSPAEIKQLFQSLSAGEIDILVGTHRVLGKTPFRNLGLLVVDEEQRFGVGHKEQLVESRKNLHVLSMSATPVPRTLQLALGGVRDLSLIETPPRDRMAVETAVVPFSKQLIREAAEHERGRGGQVYYLYNRVRDIEDIAARLKSWLPDFRIAVGHGQLPEDELAKRMHAFQDGEYDLLIATTIIANGIDIPNVNTMLVHNAQMFGLGELYQLRGRVGRSARLGYCYLMVPGDRVVTETARRRLTAIREFTELGAGFRVAARDLEIRGAGDVLGAEQSGHIASVGVETYLKLLDEAVRVLKGEDVEEPVSCAIELPGEAGIPNTYVAEPGLRLDLYQRLGEIETNLDQLLEEMVDRFGPVPPEVEALFVVTALRRRAELMRVQSLTYKHGSLYLRLRTDAKVDVEKLIQWMEEEPSVTFSPTGVLTVDDVDPAQAIAASEELVEQLWQG